jgi:hypothetical protein
MSVANRSVAAENELDTLVIFDHFWQDQSDINAIDTVSDSGTVAMGDAAGGTVVLTPSDGTVGDNDEAYLETPNEVFLIASGRPLYGRARIKVAETTADKANVAFGFQNAVGADSLIDDGGGPKVSGDTLAIFKKDGGGAYWYCAAYCNGTGTATKSKTAFATATWYDLEIFCTDNGNGTASVTYKIDGAYLRDFTTNVIISHSVTYASATEMAMWLGIKLGAATNNDTLTCDYWLGKQKAF